ncbi:tripartite tricarboxylate transporter TctB family protein [Donghicola sp. XS_ASV15]|uniref:tripartite tricarboxylate transporter TctB family protein n=1 Tax=Donghicola sp. XS_ASV15 TaxID=3241295 RepID=UPI0035123CA0
MKINDRLIGALAILGGLAVIAGTLGFREIPGQQFGSAFFPRLLGIALIFCGVAFVATAANGPMVRVGEVLKGRSGLKIATVLAAVIGWVFITPILGFILNTALLIAALAFLAGGKPFPSVATGLAMAVLLFLIFGQLLRVPLPMGVVESVLS